MKNFLKFFSIWFSIFLLMMTELQAGPTFNETVTLKCTMPKEYENVLEYDSYDTDPTKDPYQYHYKIYQLTLFFTYQPRSMEQGAQGILKAEVENLSGKNTKDHYRMAINQTYKLNAAKDEEGKYFFGREVSNENTYGVKIPLLNEAQVALDITHHFNLHGTVLFYPAKLEGAARFELFKQVGGTSVSRNFLPFAFPCMVQ